MNILIVYYSRTNVTRKVAEELEKRLNCDIEEIKDTKNRDGSLNYIISGYDALRSKPAEIKQTTKDPASYDMTIIATPVWAGTMATPILTYLQENKEKFNKVSFISTCGNTCEKTLLNMEKVIDKKPIATMTLKKDDDMNTKLDEFIKNLN